MMLSPTRIATLVVAAVMTVALVASLGSVSSASAGLPLGSAISASAGPVPASPGELMVSTSAERADAQSLEGSVLADEDAYVFWAHGGDAHDDSGIGYVEFDLDGEFVRRENIAPYDLGGTGDGVPRPYSLASLESGTHSVTATVRSADGTSQVLTRASFVIPDRVLEAPTEPSEDLTESTEGTGPDSLSWALPPLHEPTTINVSTTPNTIFLEDGKDYRIQMPSAPVTKGMAIRGGRNVVLVGGEIAIPWQGSDPSISQRRGLLIRDQTGVVHVEGLLIHGDDLSEGIQIDADDATVQLQNVRIMNVHARDQVDFSDNHPDVVQPYGGVEELRIDRLTGESDYQGLQIAEDLGPIGRVDLRRVNIHSMDTARYLLWHSGDFPMTLHEVYADSAPDRSWSSTIWGEEAWADAIQGVPDGGDFVKAGSVGIGYTSPGYAR